MTVLLPLQVKIQPIGGGTALDITASVSNLRWSSCSPGGYAECSFSFNRELTYLDEDVYGQYSPVTIYDTRDSEVLWDGLLADPGRYAGPDGESWRMVAYGAMSTTKDVNGPYVLIDSSLDSWGRGAPGAMREEVQLTSDHDDRVEGPCILMSVPKGTTLQPASGIGYVHYMPFLASGQRLGSLYVKDLTSGQNSTFRVVYTFGLNELGAWTHFHNASPSVVTQDFKAGDDFGDANTCALAWRHDGAPLAVTLGDQFWTRWGAIFVRPALVNRMGSGVSIPVTSHTNWREQIEHLVGIGNRLRFAVGTHCDIDDDDAMDDEEPIRHMSYPDGATDDQILSDLLLTENRAVWHFWERVGDNLYFFEWVAKANAVAFDLDTEYEGLDSPGSTAEIYNRVNVRARNEAGNITGLQAESFGVPVLNTAGVIREAMLDLGDNVGSSQSEMEAAASSFLDAHKHPVRAGTATVSRSIYSNFTEQWVEPWRLRSPFRVRFSGAVNDTPGSSPDGQSVFEVVRVEFDAESCIATLELSEPQSARWDVQSYERARRR